MSEKINITLERSLWDALSKVAYEQSLIHGERVSTIEILRIAIKTFLRMEDREINEILEREPRSIGYGD